MGIWRRDTEVIYSNVLPSYSVNLGFIETKPVIVKTNQDRMVSFMLFTLCLNEESVSRWFDEVFALILASKREKLKIQMEKLFILFGADKSV